jgi:hypothetical protein
MRSIVNFRVFAVNGMGGCTLVSSVRVDRSKKKGLKVPNFKTSSNVAATAQQPQWIPDFHSDSNFRFRTHECTMLHGA